MGPSAASERILPSLFNPCHLRCRFCPPAEASDDFSPLVPTYRSPLAVPAAIIPVGDIERESTKGGDSETPADGGAAAEYQESSDCLIRHDA